MDCTKIAASIDAIEVSDTKISTTPFEFYVRSSEKKKEDPVFSLQVALWSGSSLLEPRIQVKILPLEVLFDPNFFLEIGATLLPLPFYS
jgi:hypothetical protein